MGKIGIVGSGLGLMNGLVLLYVCLVSSIVSSIPSFWRELYYVIPTLMIIVSILMTWFSFKDTKHYILITAISTGILGAILACLNYMLSNDILSFGLSIGCYIAFIMGIIDVR
jgi:hypothetical protein